MKRHLSMHKPVSASLFLPCFSSLLDCVKLLKGLLSTIIKPATCLLGNPYQTVLAAWLVVSTSHPALNEELQIVTTWYTELIKCQEKSCTLDCLPSLWYNTMYQDSSPAVKQKRWEEKENSFHSGRETILIDSLFKLMYDFMENVCPRL